ncbi:LuxR C-terminal-related transcriptional regulator [Vacuolonema iberomarrocanum]|uniref:LuxR C-terminal-related transcriptional regulator n=1 Tax=Vacuolonema iberomarrocanum TaxID=3454632 RepID=UPI0019FF5547|nr:response regulator transcription factor [filamentous cyanobacterium LEGE 07170]
MGLSNPQPLRILIIEDDPLMQLGLHHALSYCPDFEVVGQETAGDAGVELALNLKPNVVIMDIGLPRLNGILATQKIKAACPAVRIVVLTSHATERETILALANGADAYCIKGSQATQIIDAIAAVQSGALYLDEKVRHVVNQLKGIPTPAFKLSDREMEVLKLLVQGNSNGAIAETLFLSESTIKAHLRSIMTKFEVNDRVQVAVIALRSGLID